MTIGDSDHRKPTYSGTTVPLNRRRSWCCSFAVPPASPDARSIPYRNQIPAKATPPPNHRSKPDYNINKPVPKSVNCSPQSSKSALIGRILSPGRVSPIDSIPTIITTTTTMQVNTHQEEEEEEEEDVITDSPPKPKIEAMVSDSSLSYDARLSLKGRNGGVLVIELSSEILASNSYVFAALIAEISSKKEKEMCRIEVCDVENVVVFKETVELMFVESNGGIVKKLMKLGVYKAIDILEVLNKFAILKQLLDF